MSDSQVRSLKSGINNGTKVTLKLSSIVATDSNDENTFPHRFSSTNTQVSKLLKGFTNG